MKYYLLALKNYATFNGRSNRQQYWMFALMNLLFLIGAAIIDIILGTTFKVGGISLPYGYMYLLYALAVFIPGLAIAVRRLHDTGKSGAFFLIVLIPLIGAVWLLVLFCTVGTTGPNKYGSDPNNPEMQDEIDQIGNNA